MPNPHRLSDEEAIFNEAIRIKDDTKRAAYLDGACREDADLRSRLEVLLKAQFDSVGFMETEEKKPVIHEQEGSIIGPYKLLQQIGEGGFGVVYMAEQKEPVRRRVAVKVIKLGMDTKQVVARFEAERQALAMMDHPNIAKVLDAGATDSGRPYFVMELVRGVPITSYCDEQKLSTQERLKLFVSVCQAIQHAHQKGIIHRDIKPNNVLIAQVDGRAEPKIIDFGVAKATQNDLTDKTLFTRFEQFIGTPAYMSPEQAGMGALDIDTRSDVYALGVLLYELLTGFTPLDTKELRGTAVDEIRRRIREVEAVRPSARVSTLDDITRNTTAERRQVSGQKLSRHLQGDLDWIVLKALEKDRGRRYETANGLAQDVERYLRNDPVEAVKPSFTYLLTKYAKRHRPALATAAALAATLVVGATVSVGQAIRAKKEESKAKVSYAEALDAKLKAEAAESRERVLKEEALGNAYTASMRQLQFDWEEGNHSRIQDTLSRQKDYTEKSFEWGFWHRALHLQKARFPTYAGGIKSIDVSHQGDRVALAMIDGTVEVRTLPKGRKITTISGHPHWLQAAILSPDGKMIATAGSEAFFEGWVKLWDATTGEEIRTLGLPGELNQQQPGTLGYSQNAITFSPDGRLLAMGGVHRKLGIQLWDVATGKRVRTLGDDWFIWNSWIHGLVFSADGTRLICRSEYGIELYDVATSRRLAALGGPGEKPRFQIGGISLSSDSRFLAVAFDQGIKVYDIHDDDFSNEVYQFDIEKGRPAFSPDGKWLLVRVRGDAYVHDAATGEYLQTIRGVGSNVDFLPGSKQFVSASGRWLKLWDVEGTHPAREIPTGYEILGLSNDGSKAVVSLGEDRKRADSGVLDLASGRLFEGKLPASLRDDQNIDGAAISPDGQLVAFGSRDGKIRVGDIRTGDIQLTIDTSGPNGDAPAQHYHLTFSSSGKSIISIAGRKEPITFWDVQSGRKEFQASVSDHGFALSNDETLMATHDGEKVTLWDVDNNERLHEPWQPLPMIGKYVGIVSIEFTLDGRFMIVAGYAGAITMWDTETGEFIRDFNGHRETVVDIAVLPDGKRLVSVGRYESVRLWDLDQGNELLVLNHPYLKNLYWGRLGVSNDGSRITLSKRWHKDKVIVWETASETEIAEWQADEEADADRWAVEEPAMREAWEQRKETEATFLKDAREKALVQRDERLANEVGAIKDWLVLAPIPTIGEEIRAAVKQEQLPNESTLRPRAGEQVTHGDEVLAWKPVRVADHELDFDEITGTDSEFSAAYAVTYLKSETELPNVRLNIGNSYLTRIYVNGQEVHPHIPKGTESVVHLKAGLNVIVMKVVTARGSWASSLWLTERSGAALPGLSVTLDPELE